MSLAARLFLALVTLVIVAGGVVIFYVLPQFETPEAAVSPEPKPEIIAAATPAPVPPPSDPGAAPLTPQTPAPQPPSDQPPPQPPADQPPPGPGAPIPLAPGSAAPAVPGDIPAAAPFEPALPGIGNIAAPVNETLVMAGTADARTEPRADAPVLLRLDKGSPILVAAVMAGRLWLQVELPDHRTGYIPAAALPQAVATFGASPGGAPAEAVAPPPQSFMAPSFMADAETLTLAARTPIYPAPDPGAAAQGVLPAGTQVQIVAKTTDGQWGWLKTADGSAAYIRLAATSSAAPASPLPDLITGRVKVLTTSSLVVDGRPVSLYGIKGLGGIYVRSLRALIDQHGGIATCTRRDTRYVCNLPGNIDIARAALYNGGATASDDAPADYREQADAARRARIGVWAR